jgi:hypothetical protein
MLGPTQRGKTTLGLQLLDKSISHEHPAVVFAGKPPNRDATMNAAAKRLNLRVANEWPPPPAMPWQRSKRGILLRPTQTLKDIDRDNATLQEHFRRALLANYASKKPVISFVDEAHHVQNDLKLRKEYEAPLMRGAPDNAVWSLIQRGRYMTYLAYDAPEHVFLFYDPDRSNQRRYSEIGGVDPDYLLRLSTTLKTARTASGRTISECIYIRRSGPLIQIVDYQ